MSDSKDPVSLINGFGTKIEVERALRGIQRGREEKLDFDHCEFYGLSMCSIYHEQLEQDQKDIIWVVKAICGKLRALISVNWLRSLSEKWSDILKKNPTAKIKKKTSVFFSVCVYRIDFIKFYQADK